MTIRTEAAKPKTTRINNLLLTLSISLLDENADSSRLVMFAKASHLNPLGHLP